MSDIQSGCDAVGAFVHVFAYVCLWVCVCDHCGMTQVIFVKLLQKECRRGRLHGEVEWRRGEKKRREEEEN